MAESLYTIEQVNGNTDEIQARRNEAGEVVTETKARSGFLVEEGDVFAARMEVLRARREGGQETSSDWTRERAATPDDLDRYQKRSFS